MILIIVILCLFFTVRGIHEVMINIQAGDWMHKLTYTEGVRAHRWHSKYYHKVSCLRDLFALYGGYMVITRGIGAVQILALGIIGWELCEIGENIARHMKLIIPYEHINFADIHPVILRGKKVYVLHAIRSVLGIGLSIYGGW